MSGKSIICGIYAMTHLATGRRYVGSAKDVAFRWRGHRAMLAKGKHHAQVLQLLWEQHGPEAFVFAVIEECPIDALLVREQAHMDVVLAEGRSRLLNGRVVAESNRGTPMSAETKAKISAALKGKPKTAEHAAKVGARHKGKVVSDETKEKLRAVQTGRTYSGETRAKLSLFQRSRVRSPESSARISAALIGRRHPKDVIDRIEESKREGRRIKKVHTALHELRKSSNVR